MVIEKHSATVSKVIETYYATVSKVIEKHSATVRMGPGVPKWLRHCATSRTVLGSIPGGVSHYGFFP